MVKNKNKKMLMYNPEKNLIINSSISDKIENLRSTLSLFKNSINKEKLDKITGVDLNIYKLINTKEAVKEMQDDSSLEWTPKEYIGKVNIPCQLCGSKKSEEKYIIRNSINNNELKVGSSCIHRFDKMNKLLHGITTAEVSRLAKKNPEKLKRIVTFNESYPGGKSIFSDWKNEYDKFDITFPSSYDDDFNKIISRGKKLYESYINNNKIHDDAIKSFANCIKDFNYFNNKCEKYNSNNEDDKYISNKRIEKYLENLNLKATLEYIRMDGKIKKDFAKHISHPDFINRFKNEIQIYFEKYGLTLLTIGEDDINFSYKYKNFAPIILKNTLKEFNNRFSDIYYNSYKFVESDLHNGLFIQNTYKTAYEFLGVLEDILKYTGYSFEIDEEMYKKDTIELRKKGLKKYVTLSMEFIILEYTKVFYLESVQAKDMLLTSFDKQNWVNISEKEKYAISEREISSYR